MKFLKTPFFYRLEGKRLMKIASGSAILTGANIVNALTLLIIIPLIIQGIGMKAYGLIVIIQAFTLVVARFFDMQPWQVYIRMVELGYTNSQAIRVGVLLDSLLLGGVLFAAGTASIFIEIWQHQSITFDIAALIALSALNQCFFSWVGVLSLEGKFVPLAMVNVLSALGRLFILFALNMLFGHLSLRTIAWVFALVEGVRLGYLISYGCWLLGKATLQGARQSIKVSKQVREFAFWNWLMNLVDLPIQYLDSILIGRFLSLEAAGIYGGVIKRLAAVFSQVSTPLYQVIFPEFTRLIAQKEYGTARHLLWRSVLIMLGVGVSGMLLLFLFRHMWMPFFGLPARYVPEVFLFMSIQVMGIAFTAVHPLVNALGLVRAGFFIILMSNSVFLLVLPPLAMGYALQGVIMAVGIQFCLAIGLKVWWSNKNMRQQEGSA